MKPKPREASVEDVDQVLNGISGCQALLNGGYCCYIYGMGGQTKDFYKKIASEKGVVVIWHDSIVTGWARIIKNVVPSVAGLLKLESLENLRSLFYSVCGSSMAGIYFMHSEMEQAFIKLVQSKVDLDKIDAFVTNNPASLIYTLDANNASSRTDQYDFLDVGEAFPKAIGKQL